MFHIVLLDEDIPYTEKIKKICQQWIHQPVEFHTYSTYFELFKHLEEADLVISNVTLRHRNQIHRARCVRNKKPNLAFIFYSENIEDALTTYEAEPEYFFMKENLETALIKALQRTFHHN